MQKTILLTPEEEKELSRKWVRDKDPDALKKLVEANLGLVRKIVNSEFYNSNYSVEDLIQEGVIGLIKAARRFDPERGFHFSTYVYYKIRSCCLDYTIRDVGQISVGKSSGHRKAFFRLPAAIRHLESLDKAVTSQALSEFMEVSETIAEEVYLHSKYNNVSLDSLAGDGSMSVGETMVLDDSNCADTLDRIDIYKIKQDILSGRVELDRRKLMIIYNRFLADEPKPLSEIGDILGVSHERVRQLEAKALQKIRQHYMPKTENVDKKKKINNVKKVEVTDDATLPKTKNVRGSRNKGHGGPGKNTQEVRPIYERRYTGRVVNSIRRNKR